MSMSKTLLFAVLAAVSTLGAQAHADFSCTKPFQRSGSIALPVNYSGSTANIYVPAGYRLKLSHVSVSITIASGARAAFEVATYADNQYGAYTLPVQTGYNINDRQTSQPIELYADPGSPVLVRAYRGTGTTTATNAQYAISGCLIPVT